ncbi:hypothetical protein THAOC_09255 [Thalassiosira oceanica]|uniref:Uncharacterized protein n=1 Tax=Thalassiosira oceanica TaxID=159749 RepID=K0SSY6_THAOC|nr:hypothetical protein THAOC_09255 [Thalassiosira oceanica]|eukprot:EJK69483.1 hypothetical protein THAOC_09255 [Thalassiosira oceanica]
MSSPSVYDTSFGCTTQQPYLYRFYFTTPSLRTGYSYSTVKIMAQAQMEDGWTGQDSRGEQPGKLRAKQKGATNRVAVDQAVTRSRRASGQSVKLVSRRRCRDVRNMGNRLAHQATWLAESNGATAQQLAGPPSRMSSGISWRQRLARSQRLAGNPASASNKMRLKEE